MTDELVEQVADQIEEVATEIEEIAEATRRLTGREVGFFFAGAGIGVAAGFAVGFRTAAKRLESRYAKQFDKELAEMREHYVQKLKAREAEELKPSLEEVERITKDEQYAPKEQDLGQNSGLPSEPEERDEVAEVEQEVEVVSSVRNVFESSTPNDHWDYAVEDRRRSPDSPYIIHADEFRQNELDHDQVEYTFYDEDEVVVDVRNNRVRNVDEVIGEENLTKFGHGSGNVYVVYIRNERLGMDMEVQKVEGSYAEIVQGHDLQHSDYRDRRQQRRRRFDDD